MPLREPRQSTGPWDALLLAALLLVADVPLGVEPGRAIWSRSDRSSVVPILGQRAHFEGKYCQEGLGSCEEYRPICRIRHFTD